VTAIPPRWQSNESKAADRPVMVADDADWLTENDRTPVHGRSHHNLTQDFAVCCVTAVMNLKCSRLLGKVVCLLVFSVICTNCSWVKDKSLQVCAALREKPFSELQSIS